MGSSPTPPFDRLPFEVSVRAPLCSYYTPRECEDEAMRKIFSNLENTKHLPHLAHEWTLEEMRKRRELQLNKQRELNEALVLSMSHNNEVVGSTAFIIIKLPSSSSCSSSSTSSPSPSPSPSSLSKEDGGFGFYGIILDQPHRGKKFAIEAELVSLLLIFEYFNLAQAIAATDKDNIPMRNFFEKGGWKLESIGKESVLTCSYEYSLSREEWPRLKRQLFELLNISNEQQQDAITVEMKWKAS